MAESKVATSYPTEKQYQRWEAEADARGMSISEFIQAMVEAGLKKFAVEVNPDETKQEIRAQRNELKQELDRARDRISDLEDQLHDQEYHSIRQYIESNPGATFEEVLQHVVDSAPRRVNIHLETMGGEEITIDDQRYYPAEEDVQGGAEQDAA